MTKQITPAMVKELRDRTHVAVGKCKEALEKAGGNMEEAIDILRKIGVAGAVKKENRETHEGMISVGETIHCCALLEVHAETDFVTLNERFREFIQEVSQIAAERKISSLDTLLKTPSKKDPTISVDQYRALTMQALGENIRFSRVSVIEKTPAVSIGIYSHMGGKIVGVVELEGGAGNEALAKNIAMHVVAASPEYLRAEDVPAIVKAREEDVARAQVEGKPGNIADKIVEGKLKFFYDQTCLLHQKYVVDDSISIAQLLQHESKKAGKVLSIRAFLRWKAGG